MYIRKLLSFYKEDFASFASKKGIAALAYQFLKSQGSLNPEEQKALEALRIAYLSALAKNSYHQREQLKVLDAFMHSGIPVIPLKGLFLSHRLYGDITSRDESVDFDLLIKEEDKERTRVLLEGLGYNFLKLDEIKEWQWVYTFTKPQHKMIELHWDITMMCRSQERIAGLWNGLEIVEWDGVKYYDFKPEELLLYLAAHLTNSDCFRTLRAVFDINRLLEKYGAQINWQRLIEKAQRLRLSGSLYTALILNRDFSGFKISKDALKQLKPGILKRLFIRAFANRNVVLRGGLRRKLLDRFLAYVFFELAEAVTFKDYLSVLKRIFIPPEEAISNKNYILRFFKGLGKLFKEII